MSSLAIGTSPLARTKRAPASTGELTVRKSAGAIQVWDSLTLLQRKLFAALLLNAYEELPNFSIVSHEIGLNVLSHLSGFNSKNTKYLKDALTAMVSTPVQWDILQPDGKSTWAVSATLASARIQDGTIHYSFSPEMRKRLYKPEAFGLLNANVIRQMKSQPALALYENCMVFVTQGADATPFWTVDTLRALLGVSGNKTYDTYKRFMEKVVRPACEEVNRVSPIVIVPEAKVAGRKVIALSFKMTVRDESEDGLASANPLHGRDAQLVMDLQENMALSYGTVVKLFEDYTDERLRAVYEYVVRKAKDGKVKKDRIGGYFLSTAARATDESLMMKQSSLFLEPAKSAEDLQREEQQKQREAAELRRKEDLRARLDSIEATFIALDESAQAVLHEEFQAALMAENDIVYNSFKRTGFTGGYYDKLLYEYLLKVGFDQSATAVA